MYVLPGNVSLEQTIHPHILMNYNVHVKTPSTQCTSFLLRTIRNKDCVDHHFVLIAFVVLRRIIVIDCELLTCELFLLHGTVRCCTEMLSILQYYIFVYRI